MNTTLTAGGKDARKIRRVAGLVFALQSSEIAGKERHLVAIWREDAPDAGIYAMETVMVAHCTQAILGCAVECLDYLGIKRPRTGSITAVARTMAGMVIGEQLASRYFASDEDPGRASRQMVRRTLELTGYRGVATI